MERESVRGPARCTFADGSALLGAAHGRRRISPEMAVRLSKAFGGSAESWRVQQEQYDLAQVKADRIKVKRLEPA
jgi:plasmid maintenance system antidote protein VapI